MKSILSDGGRLEYKEVRKKIIRWLKRVGGRRS
jgi:hypothetical protein